MKNLPVSPRESPPGLSFRERSLRVLLAGLLLGFGLYLTWVLPPTSSDVLPHQVALFCVAVAILVAVQIVGHIAAALDGTPDVDDERARSIRLEGSRNGAIVLSTGVFCALVCALLVDGNFAFTHVLLAAWVLAEVTDTLSQILLHRRGS